MGLSDIRLRGLRDLASRYKFEHIATDLTHYMLLFEREPPGLFGGKLRVEVMLHNYHSGQWWPFSYSLDPTAARYEEYPPVAKFGDEYRDRTLIAALRWLAVDRARAASV